jgi:glycosyltransferase involved in cell wall biosynthesis
MPRVLFCAYHFPPIGGAGVQRYLKLVRYLAEAGWESTVVTGPGIAGDRWAPEDRSLAAELPPSTELHRVPGPMPAGSPWRDRADRLLARDGAWHDWWNTGCAELAVAVGGECDVVFGGLQPYEMAAGVAHAAAALGKPWVADLADPWALDEMRLSLSAWHRRRDLAQMRARLATASAIVMNTEEATRRVREQLPELAGRLTEPIPNGFDSRDFEVAPAARDETRFRIVHTGYLHTELGLRQRRHRRLKRLLRGAPVPGVDILTRSHVYLLEALEALETSNPEVASRIEVVLAGVLSEADLAITREAPRVRLTGYLAHPESVALLKSADLLFLPMQNLPQGLRAGLVPGKTYEYLGAGRPILAAVPPGDARDLLEAAGNAHICAPDDVDGMAHRILAAFRERAEGGPPSPRPEVVAQYEWRELAARLASVLDDVACRRPAVSLSV